jgi:site-specific recombinase XerD
VKKHVIAAGLNSTVISTHKLRHTAATLMYKYGRVDIRSLQQILGHESIATTEIYTHVDEAQLQAAVNSNPLAMMFS